MLAKPYDPLAAVVATRAFPLTVVVTAAPAMGAAVVLFVTVPTTAP